MKTMSLYLLLILLVSLTYKLSKKTLLSFLTSIGLCSSNYRGKNLINGAGFVLLLPCLVGLIFIFLLNKKLIYILYCLVLIILALTGLLDDSLGQVSTKGLAGHLKALFKGQLSTGIIKAILGLVVGMMVSLFKYTKLIELFIDILVFSLSVNYINLLDLRPGRAIKTYFLSSALVLLMAKFHEPFMFLSIYVSLILYIGGEMKELYMLGDTGANLLGASLGFYTVMNLPLSAKGFLAIVQILIHIFAECYSISKIIDRLPSLRLIDRLGRRD